VHDNAALFTALRVAFEWDDTVIVEKALEDFTEVNCAVLGDSDEGRICVSDTEQPVGWKEFLTFADKYSGDVKHSKHKIPADIGAEQNEKVQELAEAVPVDDSVRISYRSVMGVEIPNVKISEQQI